MPTTINVKFDLNPQTGLLEINKEFLSVYIERRKAGETRFSLHAQDDDCIKPFLDHKQPTKATDTYEKTVLTPTQKFLTYSANLILERLNTLSDAQLDGIRLDELNNVISLSNPKRAISIRGMAAAKDDFRLREIYRVVTLAGMLGPVFSEGFMMPPLTPAMYTRFGHTPVKEDIQTKMRGTLPEAAAQLPICIGDYKDNAILDIPAQNQPITLNQLSQLHKLLSSFGDYDSDLPHPTSIEDIQEDDIDLIQERYNMLMQDAANIFSQVAKKLTDKSNEFPVDTRLFLSGQAFVISTYLNYDDKRPLTSITRVRENYIALMRALRVEEVDVMLVGPYHGFELEHLYEPANEDDRNFEISWPDNLRTAGLRVDTHSYLIDMFTPDRSGLVRALANTVVDNFCTNLGLEKLQRNPQVIQDICTRLEVPAIGSTPQASTSGSSSATNDERMSFLLPSAAGSSSSASYPEEVSAASGSITQVPGTMFAASSSADTAEQAATNVPS